MNSIINRFRLRLLVAANSFFFILSNQALAESNKLVSQSFDCNKAKTTSELTYCSRLDYEAADQKLNQVYQGVVSNIKNEEQKNLLVNGQLAWIKFRDNNCNFETYLSRTGREYNIYRNLCLQRVTERRTKDLENYLSIRENANNNDNISIARLPDGNYRYVTADFPPYPAIISDKELVKAGGFLYLFRKRGNQVIGTFAQIDSGNVICVNGKVEGNKVIGEATEIDELLDSARVVSSKNTFAKWDIGGYLDVRQGKKIGNKIKYSDAILNVNSFNRINAGTSLPPRSCK